MYARIRAQTPTLDNQLFSMNADTQNSRAELNESKI
jgi:hypothetical protein